MNSVSIPDLYQLFLQQKIISTDSRSIAPGSIFFALKGSNFNGNAYAEQALEKGAAFAVIDENNYAKDDRYLLVDEVLHSLQQLARHHRIHLEIPVLAITGSNGKTTTKELIRSVLSMKYNTFSTRGNLNNHIGVPVSILSVTQNHEVAVIEMGANHPGEIAGLCEIALPSHGLITNVGKAHLEGFGGFEGVKKAKGELYEFIAKNDGTVFINSGNKELMEMAGKSGIKNQVTYSISGDTECKGVLLASQPYLKVNWEYPGKKGTATSKLIGEYNMENILASICTGNYFSVETDSINRAIESYEPDNSRSQVVTKGTNKIILDAYNANPTSMAAALNNFSSLPEAHKIIFLGEMSELGEESATEHQAIARILETIRFDELVLVGKNFSNISIPMKCFHFSTSDDAAAFVKEKNYNHAVILIKGSRSTRMEKVFEAL